MNGESSFTQKSPSSVSRVGGCTCACNVQDEISEVSLTFLTSSSINALSDSSWPIRFFDSPGRTRLTISVDQTAVLSVLLQAQVTAAYLHACLEARRRTFRDLQTEQELVSGQKSIQMKLNFLGTFRTHERKVTALKSLSRQRSLNAHKHISFSF